MKKLFPAMAKRSLALALALALLLSLCPTLPLVAKAESTEKGTWTYKSGYEWITGAVTAADADMAYEGEQPYDWAVTVTPSKNPPASADVVASVKDAEGNVVSSYTGTVSMAQHTTSTVCAPENFPELASLNGEFTLTCDVKLSGATYAGVVVNFSRTGATPTPGEGEGEGDGEGEGEGGGETNTVTSAYVKGAVSGADAKNMTLSFYNWREGEVGPHDPIGTALFSTVYYWDVGSGLSFNYTLSDAFMEDFDGNVIIDVYYIAAGPANVSLVYHSTSGTETIHPNSISVVKEDGYPVKKATFTLTDAVFTNACELGCSFLLKVNSDRFRTTSVEVTKASSIQTTSYTVALNSEVADKKFYDETPFDLNLVAGTTGENEVVTVNYTLTGGNDVNLTDSKSFLLTAEGVNVLDAEWFATNAIGFGDFTLDVTMTKEGEEGAEPIELAKETFTFSRNYTSPLSSELTSAIAENRNGVLVFGEDATMDLVLNLKNKLSVPFNGTLTYTVSLNGAVIEGYEGLTATIADLTETTAALNLPDTTAYGTYELAISVADDEGAVVHTNTFKFARAKNEFVLVNASSENGGSEFEFIDDEAFDIVLTAQKEDGFAEELTFAYTLTKDGEEVKSDSFTAEVSSIAPGTAIDLSQILADVEGFGTFNLNLTITNSLGNTRELACIFTRIESVKAELSSATNSDLVFTDDEAYDLKLSLLKLVGEDREFTVNYTVAQGENVIKTNSIANVAVTDTANVLDLDMTDVNSNGTFTITVTLVEGEETVKTLQYTVIRKSSMTVSLAHPGAFMYNEKLTYIDLVPYDFSVSMQKPQGEAEDVTVNYIVTDAEGKEVAAGTATASVGSTEATAVALDLTAVEGFGNFNLAVTVLDANGNEVATTSLDYLRWDTITSQLTSDTNPDLVFTGCDEDEKKDAFDVKLVVRNAAGRQKLSVTLAITGPGLEQPLTKTVNISNTASATAPLNSNDFFPQLATMNGAGVYTVKMTVVDEAGRLREDVSYNFYRVAKDGTINSAVTSESSEQLVFVPGGEIDMMLQIAKLDGVNESFKGVITITDADGNEQAKAEDDLILAPSIKVPVKELLDLSTITTSGVYNINLTLTDNSGNVRHENTVSFTLVQLEGSVDAAVTSESNPDMIYTEGEAFDMVLHLRKNDDIAEAFKAVITVTDKNGVELKTKEANVPATVQIKTAVSDLIDLSGLPATGSYTLKMVLTDTAGNERLTLEQQFHRVKKTSVKTQVSSNTNKDMIFIDKDTVDLMLYVQKTDGIDEELNIQYTVYAPDGTELNSASGNTVVPSGERYFKMEVDAGDTSAHGFYTVKLVVTDNSGIERSNTETKFVRISGWDIKHQVSGSSSGTKMQFTPGMKLDLCLFVQKLDGVPETLKGNLYVVSPSGAVIFSISGNMNIPAGSRYFKFALPLQDVANEFGTYKVYYTLHDDAGNLRVSNTVSFVMINPSGDVRVALQSASGKFPGLIYGKDDAYDLALYMQKTDGIPETMQLRYTISDMNGIVLETKQGRIEVPATSYRKLPIELPDIEAFEKYGIFNMKVEVANTTGKIVFTENYSFTRVLTPETQLDVMGVCTHLSKRGMTTKQSQQYVDLARNAGISFWRDELPWSSVEAAKGQYKIPASADAAVDYTLSIGLEPLFILDYGNNLYGSDVTTDEWLEGYLGYVEYMVTHFKGRIKYYEVWNEWNIGLGGMDKKYRDYPELYARVLVATYKVIKEIDPTITVIGGVVAGGELDWTEGMLQYPGAIDAMDAYSFHHYPDNDMKEIVEKIEGLRELFTKYGRGDIPMWLTETGWPTHLGRLSFSEETAAGNLVSLFAWAMANPDALDQIFWYDLHNDGTEREQLEHNLGLLHNWDTDENAVPMAAKPAFVALNAMNAILGDAEFVDTYDLGHKKITAYHFKKDGKDLLVAWADDCSLNMVATVGENNIIVTDMYGNANALAPVNGKVSLFFSDAPIYIEYDLSQKVELVEGGFELDKEQYTATPGAVFPVKITRNNGLETQAGSYIFSMPDTWSVEGIEFGAAAAGATEVTDTVYVTVGDDATKGEMTITARVVIGGNVVGQFNIPIEMGDICTVNPDVVFTDDGAEFKLSVQILNENSTKPLAGTINLLAPNKLIGEASSIPFEIPAGENKAVLIDLPADVANNFYNVKLEVVLGSGAKHVVTKPVSFLYAIKAPENMKMDGVVDEQWDGAMEFSAGEDNWEIHTGGSSDEWPGITFKGYTMWDDQYLYVAVVAHDDSHYQDASGTSIWLGDSIQLATDVTRFTVPGYNGYNQIGVSLNNDRTTIENWNWFAAPGKNVSEGGIFHVIRDDATSTTTYEIALPWTELLPAGEEFNLKTIGFSLLLNDNSLDEEGDPTGRTGWIEYMSGIGRRKDPMAFGDLILAERPNK